MGELIGSESLKDLPQDYSKMVSNTVSGLPYINYYYNDMDKAKKALEFINGVRDLPRFPTKINNADKRYHHFGKYFISVHACDLSNHPDYATFKY